AIWAGLVRALIVVDAWVYPPAKPARHSPKRPSNPVKTPPRLRVTSAALPSLLIRPQAPTPCAQNVRSGDCCGAPNSWLIAWLGRSPSREAEVLSPAGSAYAKIGPPEPSAAKAPATPASHAWRRRPSTACRM